MEEFNTDNIDRFGHCVVCHNNLLTKRVVDGEIVDMFLPTYDETMFLLNTGSQIQVTICKKCKENVDLTAPAIQSMIMLAVRKGWRLETNLKVSQGEWDKESAERHLESTNKLSIDCHSEKLDKYVIQTRQMELIKAKVEELKEFNDRQIKNTDDVKVISVEEVPIGSDINS